VAIAAVLVIALAAGAMYLFPAPRPTGAVGPSTEPSASHTPTPFVIAGSPTPTTSSGQTATPSSTAATGTPTPTPTPAPTLARGTGNLVTLPAMAPYLTGPAVNLDGVHVLVAGGMVSNAGGVRMRSNLAEVFNEGSHTWSATGPMNDARYDHTATLLPDGRVLVTGGADLMDGIDNLATAEIYDPATGKWTRTGSMKQGRAGHTATLLVDGRVLIAGGFGGGTQPVATAEIYDPATGRFTAAGSMTVARMNQAAAPLPGGKVLITGGVDDNSNVLSTAEVYDPATGTFTSTGSMTTERTWHTATTLGDGRLLIAGGTGGSATGPEPLASAEIYDPANGRFTATGSMTTRRWDQTATLLTTGQVIVAGGEGTNSLEVYWPDTGKFGYARTLAGPISAAASLGDRVLLVGSPPQLYCPWAAAWSPCQ
jgi:hypothetical protein